MTRIEAIRQRAERRTSPYGDIEAQEDMDALLTLWDTRETALRDLVERVDEMLRANSMLYAAGISADMREPLEEIREALSRLLEQEP